MNPDSPSVTGAVVMDILDFLGRKQGDGHPGFSWWEAKEKTYHLILMETSNFLELKLMLKQVNFPLAIVFPCSICSIAGL